MSSALLADNGIIQVLTFLLPGFVAAALYYFLISHPNPKPNEFGQIIHALVFTTIGQIAWIIVERLSPISGEWGVPISVTGAVAAAIILVGVSNNDLAHRFFRWLRFTKGSSYSVWYSTFSRNTDSYVVLHLTHNRQLYGWPSEWPTDPDDEGYIRIVEGEWLDESRDPLTAESDQDRAYLPTFLIPTKEVEMVEFIHREPTDP